MTSVSCLASSKKPLVLDSSVIVNLNATGIADRILDAVPVSIVVPDPVVRELRQGASVGHSDATDLERLLDQGLAETVKIPLSAQSDYIHLVSGSAVSSLGDGEAATIVCAFATDAWATIDERKARRICSERYQGVHVASTLDILAHPQVLLSLTEQEFSAALLAALEIAHMQIQREQMDWVASKIDPDRIANCTSLPLSVRKTYQRGEAN